MTVWLGRQEAVTRFQAYLVYAAKQTNTSTQDSHQLDSDSEDLDNDDLNDTSVPILMSVKPAYPHVGISTITTEFKVTGFIHALTTYIQRAFPPPAQPLLPSTADQFDVY